MACGEDSVRVAFVCDEGGAVEMSVVPFPGVREKERSWRIGGENLAKCTLTSAYLVCQSGAAGLQYVQVRGGTRFGNSELVSGGEGRWGLDWSWGTGGRGAC